MTAYDARLDRIMKLTVRQRRLLVDIYDDPVGAAAFYYKLSAQGKADAQYLKGHPELLYERKSG